ncbi:hypothetical protein KEM52_004504 [Ascosphaera acerosa]|nr:hypothetical protein KEM52_004504 [Ascosphaera acerosa]
MGLEQLSSPIVLRIIQHLPSSDLRNLHHVLLTTRHHVHTAVVQEQLCRAATSRDILEGKPLSLASAAICNNVAAFALLARRSAVLSCRLSRDDLARRWQLYGYGTGCRREVQFEQLRQRRYVLSRLCNVTTLLNLLCVLVAESQPDGDASRKPLYSHAGEMLSTALCNGATQDETANDTRYIVRTCIGFAAQGGHLRLLRQLVESDRAYREKQHRFRPTLARALGYAVRAGHLDVVRYLTQLDHRALALWTRTAEPAEFGCGSYLALAAVEGRADVFRFLLGLPGQRERKTALQEALCKATGVACGPVVEELLSSGVEPTVTAVIYALAGDDASIIRRIVERLRKLRADAGAMDDEQQLHHLFLRHARSRGAMLAVIEVYPAIVTEPGVLDIVYDVRDYYGEIRDSQRRPGKEEVGLLLIERGCLKRSGTRASGAGIGSGNASGNASSITRKRPVKPDTLFTIAMLGHARVLAAVLACNPNLAGLVDGSLGSLLDAAVREYVRMPCGGSDGGATITPDLIALLTGYGLDVDSVPFLDTTGRTPLMHICACAPRPSSTQQDNDREAARVHELVRSLIAAGADIYRRDKHGRTAMDLAEKVGNEAAVEVLSEAWFDDDRITLNGMHRGRGARKSKGKSMGVNTNRALSSCLRMARRVSWKVHASGRGRHHRTKSSRSLLGEEGFGHA